MSFVYLFLYFVVIDNTIALFNCFFRDFRVFDLVKTKSIQQEINYMVEVIKIKVNVKVVFKVQKQLFADVLQNRRS